jgi:hypothetical protein
MVVCNAWLLHSQGYCTNPISTNCWVLHIQTTSYFESNHNKFKIGTQSTFKLVGTSTQPRAKTFTPIWFSTSCKIGRINHNIRCCPTNTTTYPMCLAKCAYYRSRWMTICLMKFIDYECLTYYSNCINMCILSTRWT